MLVYMYNYLYKTDVIQAVVYCEFSWDIYSFAILHLVSAMTSISWWRKNPVIPNFEYECFKLIIEGPGTCWEANEAHHEPLVPAAGARLLLQPAEVDLAVGGQVVLGLVGGLLWPGRHSFWGLGCFVHNYKTTLLRWNRGETRRAVWNTPTSYITHNTPTSTEQANNSLYLY